MALTRRVQYTPARGLLILIQPEEDEDAESDGGVSDADALAMLHWVEHSNTLLVLSKKATGVHRILNIVPTEDATAQKQQFVRVHLDPELGSSFGYLRDIHTLSVAGKSILPARAGALPLWSIDGAPAPWSSARERAA